jgi:hypothetical protein
MEKYENEKSKNEVKQKSGNDVKDTLFRKLFSEKERAIELCNALECTNYQSDVNAMVCSLDDSLLRRYNDSAIAIENKLIVFSEHQSSLNPNMPIRMLSYVTDTYYSWFVKMKEIYKEQLFKIPTPKFYVLYNGEKELTQDVLRLSDAFELESGEFTLELTVKVLNVNFGSGCDALEKSPSLKGYSYLVELIRQHQKSGLSRDKAIKPAIKQCIDENILAEFLQENFEEVANMLAREYRIEDEIEARVEEGLEKHIVESAKRMLRSGRSLSETIEILELTDNQIKQLKGVAV